MLRTMLLCLLSMAALTVGVPSLHAQESSIVKPPPSANGMYCVTLYGDCSGTIKRFCCSYTDSGTARQCAMTALTNAGCTYLPMPNEVKENCTDRFCPVAPDPLPDTVMMAQPRATCGCQAPEPCRVYLACVFCNGERREVEGYGENYCEALNSAKESAIAIGQMYFGGLKCYCVSKTSNCCAPKCKPAKRFRLFR